VAAPNSIRRLHSAAELQPSKKMDDSKWSYTEGVRKFQPTVELWQPLDQVSFMTAGTLKGFGAVVNQP
jgi:hypothetical protein